MNLDELDEDETLEHWIKRHEHKHLNLDELDDLEDGFIDEGSRLLLAYGLLSLL
jgi:hypothetical protein